MFMVSFILVIVFGLIEWKQVCADFILFVYISIAVEDPVIKRAGLRFY